MLVNKKLKQAQRLYEKNQQGRMTFMKNIGDALKEPAQSLAESAAKLNAPEGKQLTNQADVLVRLVDEIQLANMLGRIKLMKLCLQCCLPSSVKVCNC